MKHNHAKPRGFTIVELLVAIVVVGILIAIITASYLGVAKRAAGERLKSDLIESATNLSKFKADKGIFPSTLRCDIPDSSTNLCVKTSSADVVLDYSVNTSTSPDTYGLTVTKANDNDISYRTVNGSEPIPCPVGYIVVPGSKTYNTSSFCVMKYEAKIKGNDDGNQTYNSSFVPESRAAGTPWVNINQNTAITESSTACEGCHLISEAEWMTLAQNVLKVDSNWSGGTVGSGYIYAGHNDNAPPNSLAAGPDSAGYTGTGDTSGYQRRTLTLSNGEVIWDMAGNVYEWTSGQTSGRQPGVIGSGLADRQWPAVTASGTLPVDTSPRGTGITGADLWTSTNRIGMIRSNYDDTTLHGMLRSGSWESQDRVGVLCLNFDVLPTSYGSKTGFRAAR